MKFIKLISIFIPFILQTCAEKKAQLYVSLSHKVYFDFMLFAEIGQKDLGPYISRIIYNVWTKFFPIVISMARRLAELRNMMTMSTKSLQGVPLECKRVDQSFFIYSTFKHNFFIIYKKAKKEESCLTMEKNWFQIQTSHLKKCAYKNTKRTNKMKSKQTLMI